MFSMSSSFLVGSVLVPGSAGVVEVLNTEAMDSDSDTSTVLNEELAESNLLDLSELKTVEEFIKGVMEASFEDRKYYFEEMKKNHWLPKTYESFITKSLCSIYPHKKEVVSCLLCYLQDESKQEMIGLLKDFSNETLVNCLLGQALYNSNNDRLTPYFSSMINRNWKVADYLSFVRSVSKKKELNNIKKGELFNSLFNQLSGCRIKTLNKIFNKVILDHLLFFCVQDSISKFKNKLLFDNGAVNAVPSKGFKELNKLFDLLSIESRSEAYEALAGLPTSSQTSVLESHCLEMRDGFLGDLSWEEVDRWLAVRFPVRVATPEGEKRRRVVSKEVPQNLSAVLQIPLIKARYNICGWNNCDNYQLVTNSIERVVQGIREKGQSNKLKDFIEGTTIGNKVLLFPFISKEEKNEVLSSLEEKHQELSQLASNSSNAHSNTEFKKEIVAFCEALPLVVKCLSFDEGMKFVKSLMNTFIYNSYSKYFFQTLEVKIKSFNSRNDSHHNASANRSRLKYDLSSAVPIVMACCGGEDFSDLCFDWNASCIKTLAPYMAPREEGVLSLFCDKVRGNTLNFVNSGSIQNLSMDRYGYGNATLKELHDNFSIILSSDEITKENIVAFLSEDIGILSKYNPLLVGMFFLSCPEASAWLPRILSCINDDLFLRVCANFVVGDGSIDFLEKSLSSLSQDGHLSFIKSIPARLQVQKEILLQVLLAKEAEAIEGSLSKLEDKLYRIEEASSSEETPEEEEFSTYQGISASLGGFRYSLGTVLTRYRTKLIEYAKSENVLIEGSSCEEYLKGVDDRKKAMLERVEYVEEDIADLIEPEEELEVEPGSWSMDDIWQSLRSRDLIDIGLDEGFSDLPSIGLSCEEDFSLIGFDKSIQDSTDRIRGRIREQVRLQLALKVNEATSKELKERFLNFLDKKNYKEEDFTQVVDHFSSIYPEADNEEDMSTFVSFYNNIQYLKGEEPKSKEAILDIIRNEEEFNYKSFTEEMLMLCKKSYVKDLLETFLLQGKVKFNEELQEVISEDEKLSRYVTSFKDTWVRLGDMGINSLDELSSHANGEEFDALKSLELARSVIQVDEQRKLAASALISAVSLVVNNAESSSSESSLVTQDTGESSEL
jgi:hypothetical protein